MAACEIIKINSNTTGLRFAEEVCLTQLPDLVPDSGLGDAAVWYGVEPNSYSDFGSEISRVESAPISASRQRKKGAVTGLEAKGGFNADFKRNSQLRLLQSFFFSDAREKGTTYPLNGAKATLTAVDSAAKTFSAAAATDLDVRFAPNDLVLAENFGVTANDGVKLVTAVTDTTVVVAEALFAEAAVPVAAVLRKVGYQLPAGDIDLALVGNIPSLVSTVTDFTGLDIEPGEWIFIGGDLAAHRFGTARKNVGYARVHTVLENSITFDKITFSVAVESGAGKSIRIFIGTTIRNEADETLIKEHPVQFERTLGRGAYAGVQAEYLKGCVGNELTINMAMKDKITIDMSFVACDHELRSGAPGVETTIKPGVRFAPMVEEIFNTSTDVYRQKLSVIDPLTAMPGSLFAYATEMTLGIKNGVTPDNAIGIRGAIDMSFADFVVDGSGTFYFRSTEAIEAVRNNADVTFDSILASDNGGVIIDVPTLSLGDGKLAIEKDKAVMVSLSIEGNENELGYTAQMQSFAYLPNIAMPVVR